MASNAVRLGEARHALVIGAERTSEWIDPNDLDTFVIFGDGAGAAVVSRSETAGIGPAVWGQRRGAARGARHHGEGRRPRVRHHERPPGLQVVDGHHAGRGPPGVPRPVSPWRTSPGSCRTRPTTGSSAP
ncbi:hypothetical protein LV779_13755 [Streptomyces thinghirensis]|nr:hypothetical protein [Streptomyces thinghirensis]